LNVIRYLLAGALVMVAFPVVSMAQTTKYKCMIQMTNYMGEGA
jgi:hypothetical protein